MQFIKKLTQNKILYILLALTIVFLPQVMNETAESERRAIVVVVGLDKVENQIEVSAAIVLPKNASNLNLNLHSVSQIGNTVDEAIYKLGLQLGKRIGMAHCQAIVISEELFEDNILTYLDFFIRTNNITRDSTLFATSDKAKDIVNLMAASNDPNNYSVKNVIEYNNDNYLPVYMNVQNFYKAYYSPQSIALMAVIGIKDTDESGDTSGTSVQSMQGGGSGDKNISSGNSQSSNQSSSSSSLGSSSSSSSSSGSGSSQGAVGSQKIMQNSDELVLIKEGKIIQKLQQPAIDFIYLTDNTIEKTYISVSDVDVQEFHNATVTCEVFNKKIKKQTFFNNGVPVFGYDLVLYLKFDEVNASEYNVQSLDEISSFFYDVVKQKIVSKVKQDFANLVNTCRQDNADVLAVYDNFNKFHNAKWQEYINSLDNPQDYLSKVVFQVNIDIRNKL